MKRFLLICALLVVCLAQARPKFDDADKARIDGTYAKVLYKDGHKAVYPMKSLTADKQAQVQEIAALQAADKAAFAPLLAFVSSKATPRSAAPPKSAPASTSPPPSSSRATRSSTGRFVLPVSERHADDHG